MVTGRGHWLAAGLRSTFYFCQFSWISSLTEAYFQDIGGKTTLKNPLQVLLTYGYEQSIGQRKPHGKT